MIVPEGLDLFALWRIISYVRRIVSQAWKSSVTVGQVELIRVMWRRNHVLE